MKVICTEALGIFDHKYTKDKMYDAKKYENPSYLFTSYSIKDDSDTIFRFYESDFIQNFIELKELRKTKLNKLNGSNL